MRTGSTRFTFASLELSDLILLATSLHLLAGVITHILWLVWGNEALFRYYFSYQDPLFLLVCTILEFSLTYSAWKQFSSGQTLRWAWLLIMISALCQVVGMVLGRILSADSYINPLYVIGAPWYKSVSVTLLPLVMFIGGPLQMVALGSGLFLSLRLCRKFQVRAKMKAIDWVIVGIVVIYTLHVASVVIRLRWRATPSPGFKEIVNWANDPLLCVLLCFAFFLRRSADQMGWGLIAKCWGAYVVAILGTSLASMLMWAANFGILRYPESAIVWYVWPIIFAAYALGPAYQVEAAQVAQRRLEHYRPKLYVQGLNDEKSPQPR